MRRKVRQSYETCRRWIRVRQVEKGGSGLAAARWRV